MKFRSLLHIGIATLALIFQVILAKKYEGIGCAFAVAGALLLGQGLIMNIYYQKRQGIDIVAFWKEIIKMSIVPIIISVVFRLVISEYNIDSWSEWLIFVSLFVAMYLPIFYLFSMNKYEKDLLKLPLNRLFSNSIKL